MWRVGDEVEVRVHSRPGAEERRGTIVIENLDGVLRNLPPGGGANGPLAPVTQYLLREAATQMSERLGQLAASGFEGEEHVVGVLSRLVGHEPFVTNTLGLSVHQMRRRWPMAADWYADLVRYILHAARTHVDMRSLGNGRYLQGLTLAQFISMSVSRRRESYLHPELLDLAATIQAMWPEYEPVRDSVVETEERMRRWGERVVEIFGAFGLYLRPEATIGEVLWTFHVVSTTEERRARSRSESPLFADVGPAAPGGQRYPYAARATMLTLAGALVDADGRSVPLAELYERRVPTVPAGVG